MAIYKVPQDVEADDKLLGPFSPRQTLYLGIVVMAGALAWFLGTLFIPLAFITSPVILLFGALALPLRKDQPMETYLAAIVSFFLKSRKRIWEPDGIDSIIEITAPKTVELSRIKDISRGEAEKRLSYLAQIVDSQGWAVRGAGVTAPNNAMITDAYFEAQQTDDMMDTNNATAQSFSQKLSQTEAKHHQNAVNMLQNKPQPNSTTQNQPAMSDLEKEMAKEINYNPYPSEIHQTIIQPLSERPVQTQPKTPESTNKSTSEKAITADIINLASNNDLSIETIAREAERIHKKQDIVEEVIISLR